jgi:serine/threonine-protein kinase
MRVESPRRIGRYDIVGRLATGGMGEVLLGRVSGPFGFEKPVVIKRLLPHLAVRRSAIERFLDEARIIANLRHPNLVHVHELGHDGADLFIAMEYLVGETVAGLCRRLALRGESIDLALALHVVAEASAGLHAAHEARSPDGRPLGIVHRDVSPDNVFIEYSGAVHVIDFGIATSVDREGKTELGKVVGKTAYIAPERLEDLPCDRRADVFGLGIVLFELTTGHRLFKRETYADTVLAIMNERVTKLGDYRADVPAEVEDICARALAKDRNRRTPTALDMRRECLAFLRKESSGDHSEMLAALMTRVFDDQIEAKQEMLRALRSGQEVASVPRLEADERFVLPTVDANRPSTAPSGDGRRRLTRERVQRPLLLVASLIAGFLLSLSFGARVTSTAAQASFPQPAPAVTSTIAPLAAKAEGSAPPRRVHVRVESSPVSATVVLDGRPQGTCPVELELEPDTGGLDARIELRAPGYKNVVQSIHGARDQIVRVEMAPIHERDDRARRTRKKHSNPAPAQPTLW